MAAGPWAGPGSPSPLSESAELREGRRGDLSRVGAIAVRGWPRIAGRVSALRLGAAPGGDGSGHRGFVEKLRGSARPWAVGGELLNIPASGGGGRDEVCGSVGWPGAWRWRSVEQLSVGRFPLPPRLPSRRAAARAVAGRSRPAPALCCVSGC